MIKNDARCTCEMKSRISAEKKKTIFNRKKNLYNRKLDLNLRNKL
jgi:hypothetical protein